MASIIESGLTFGPYPDAHCFYIEKSAAYQAVQARVQMAEFLVLRFAEAKPAQIRIVEAKSSSPRAGNPVRFGEFIHEIKEKLTNGLSLGLAACLKRHAAAEAELSADFKNLDLAAVEFRLVLVINGHKKEWLAPLQDALTKAMHSVTKTWALGANAVVVLNEEGARKFGLIR